MTELTVSVGDKVGRDEIVARVQHEDENTQAHEALVADLSEQLARVRDGRRREGARAAHVRAASCSRASASTGCSTRARRSWSCSPLAAHGMYDGDAPGAGIVTGVGRVSAGASA